MIKSWKSLICSLKDRRKPPSHDGRSGFSAGPRMSLYTALIMAETCPLRALTSLNPEAPASLRTFILHGMPATYLHAHNFSPVLLGSLLTTPLQSLPCLFLDRHTGHFGARALISPKPLPWCPGSPPLPLLLHPPPHTCDSHDFAPLLVGS
jgi:hypothetical protein